MYASLTQHVSFHVDKPKIELLYQTDFTKEMRLTARQGQSLAAHSSPLPITVYVVSGHIYFRTDVQQYELKAGDMVSLEAEVVHELLARAESVVRLTMHKIAKQ